MPKAAKIIKIVRVGSMRIDVRKYGDDRVGFDYYPAGQERVKVRLREVADAVARAEEVLGATQGGKIDLLGIDPEKFKEFLLWESEQLRKATVPELVTKLLAAKKRKGVSGHTYDDLEGDLTRFAETFTGPITRLSRADVEEWIDSLPEVEAPRSWNNVRASVVSLIRYARSDNYVSGAKTPAEQIEKKKVNPKKETYNVAQAIQLLKSFSPTDEWLPAVVLGLFAHVRPHENCPVPKYKKPPLEWKHFRWEKKIIRMPKEVSKVNRARDIPLLPVTLDLLRPWRRSHGPVVPPGYISNQYGRWEKASGLEWKDDVLRHTSASHRLAIIKSVPQLSLEMGSSEKMIHDHYLELKDEDEAEEYYAIRAVTLWPGWNFPELSAT